MKKTDIKESETKNPMKPKNDLVTLTSPKVATDQPKTAKNAVALRVKSNR